MMSIALLRPHAAGSRNRRDEELTEHARELRVRRRVDRARRLRRLFGRVPRAGLPAAPLNTLTIRRPSPDPE
jgi:hypothetical protein